VLSSARDAQRTNFVKHLTSFSEYQAFGSRLLRTGDHSTREAQNEEKCKSSKARVVKRSHSFNSSHFRHFYSQIPVWIPMTFPFPTSLRHEVKRTAFTLPVVRLLVPFPFPRWTCLWFNFHGNSYGISTVIPRGLCPLLHTDSHNI